jgi:hypothetical protein
MCFLKFRFERAAALQPSTPLVCPCIGILGISGTYKQNKADPSRCLDQARFGPNPATATKPRTLDKLEQIRDTFAAVLIKGRR